MRRAALLLLVSLMPALPTALQAQIRPFQETLDLPSSSHWKPYTPPTPADTSSRYEAPDDARQFGLVPPARWLSVDPLAEKHPDWTPYNYVLGNPLYYVDPDGRQDMAIIGAVNSVRQIASSKGHDPAAAAGQFITSWGVGSAKSADLVGRTLLEPYDYLRTGIDLGGDALRGEFSWGRATAEVGLAATPFIAGGLGRTGFNILEAVGDAARTGDNIRVIGRLEDTKVAKDWPGHEILDVKDWNLDVNDAWVKTGIDNKATFYVGSPKQGNLIDPRTGKATVFSREFEQLEQAVLEAGYVRIDDYYVHPDNLR